MKGPQHQTLCGESERGQEDSRARARLRRRTVVVRHVEGAAGHGLAREARVRRRVEAAQAGGQRAVRRREGERVGRRVA
eukprot:943567-Prymnesium_polylepis.1